MTLFKSSPKTIEVVSIKIAICFIAFVLLAVLLCPAGSHSREDSSKIEDLSKIDSGFFISKDDVYGLPDQVFKEKVLLFLTEKGILTKSFRGLIYYYISDDAIAQIEQLEFKAHLMEFVTDPLERKVHIVQPGDSLWDIATKYRISVEELVYLNNITPIAPIYPGQRLRVAPEEH
jgi:hypothetical protein